MSNAIRNLLIPRLRTVENLKAVQVEGTATAETPAAPETKRARADDALYAESEAGTAHVTAEIPHPSNWDSFTPSQKVKLEKKKLLEKQMSRLYGEKWNPRAYLGKPNDLASQHRHFHMIILEIYIIIKRLNGRYLHAVRCRIVCF